MSKTSEKRHDFVDALRGFALLGIVLVNIEFIVQPAEIGWLNYDGTLDRVVRFLVVALGQTKIYPLFAMLFGYGLSIQLRNAARRGEELGGRYRRRMVGLAVLGVAHGVLFFPGDILVIYSVIGALAYRFRDTDTRRLVRLAAIVYSGATLCWLLLGGLDALGDVTPPVASQDAVEILANGSFVEVVVVHFFYWLVTLGMLSLVQGPAVVACFLIGIALGRTTILAEPEAHSPIAGKVLRLFPLGILGAGIGAALTVMVGGRWDTMGFAIGFAAAPLMAAGYIVLMARTVGRQSSPIGTLLQAAGRMSLTVYLLESVIASTVAYGYGLGWFSEVGPAQGVVLAVGIWLALSLFALAWMDRRRFGPFEWLLRALTYGERPRVSGVQARSCIEIPS